MMADLAFAGVEHGVGRVATRIPRALFGRWDMFMTSLVLEYFRAECPPLSECYRRMLRVAKLYGWDAPSAGTAGGIIRKLSRDPKFRAYRRAGGGYLYSVELVA